MKPRWPHFLAEQSLVHCFIFLDLNFFICEWRDSRKHPPPKDARKRDLGHDLHRAPCNKLSIKTVGIINQRALSCSSCRVPGGVLSLFLNKVGVPSVLWILWLMAACGFLFQRSHPLTRPGCLHHFPPAGPGAHGARLRDANTAVNACLRGFYPPTRPPIQGTESPPQMGRREAKSKECDGLSVQGIILFQTDFEFHWAATEIPTCCTKELWKTVWESLLPLHSRRRYCTGMVQCFPGWHSFWWLMTATFQLTSPIFKLYVF